MKMFISHKDIRKLQMLRMASSKLINYFSYYNLCIEVCGAVSMMIKHLFTIYDMTGVLIHLNTLKDLSIFQ